LGLTVRRAVVMAVLLGILGPAFVTGIFLTRSFYDRQLDSAINHSLSRNAEIITLGVRENLWALDKDSANALIDAVMLEPDVVNIEIFDAHHNVFASRQRAGFSGTPRHQLENPILYDEREIGRLRLEISDAPFKHELMVHLLTTFATLGLQLAASILLILLVLRHRIVQPLMRLHADAIALAQGDLDSVIRPLHDDEIGQVGQQLEMTRRALKDLFATLEQRVVERTAVLEATNTELEKALEHLHQTQDHLIRSEKMAALGALVAGVAHELNTPIGNSLLVSSTFQESTRHFQGEITNGLRRSSLLAFVDEAETACAILMRNLGHAAELITSFKQVAVDQTSSQRRSFDLAEMIGEVILTLSPAFKKSCAHVENLIPPGIQLNSYPGPLGQVVTNLINNALLHAFENREEGRITLEMAPDDDQHVIILCRDDGIGISPRDLPRIFDPFFTTRLDHSGSGLGLNIVHNIVTGMLGGEIHVHSNPGQGSIFSLHLPRSAPRTSVQLPATNFINAA